MRFFFYGTLIDADVRAAVLGRRVAVMPAILRGWRRVTVTGATYPTVVADRASRVRGVLTGEIAPAGVRKLVRYEGPKYRTVNVTARAGGRDIAARVFVTAGSRRAPAWSFAQWRLRQKRAWLAYLKSA